MQIFECQEHLTQVSPCSLFGQSSFILEDASEVTTRTEIQDQE